MSREIKFEYGFESVNGIIKKVYHLHQLPYIGEICDIWQQLVCLYVRQFTGLKDKNGVDIYEGDTFNYRNNIFKCTFKGDRFGLEVLNQETCSGGEINKHYSLYLVSNIIKVIGNIHENKD